MAEQEFDRYGLVTNTLKRNFVLGCVLALIIAVSVLWYALSSSYNSRLAEKDELIESLTRERDEFKYFVVPKLKHIEPKLDKVEQRIDTISAMAEKAENNFSKILKKTKDAVSK